MAVPFVSIVAQASGTGKTRLVEKLIAELTRRGWRVGAVKANAQNVSFDHEGKDSWLFTQAGAVSTAVFSTEQLGLIRHINQNFNLAELISLLGEVDIILSEGYKQAGIPKIEVVRAALGQTGITDDEDLVAVVTDVSGLSIEVPQFSFQDTEGLAGFLEREFIRQKIDGTLTHFDQSGRARMVDVSAKPDTLREAIAAGEITMGRETLALVKSGHLHKGDVLAVAQVAAVMGVKETGRLIPMCHPLFVSGVAVDFEIKDASSSIEVKVAVKTTGPTGIEMEALTGVSTALLTIYDMCKAVDKGMVMGGIRLLEKKGGRSGHFVRQN